MTDPRRLPQARERRLTQEVMEVLDRHLALQVLGLSERAGEAEIRAAFSALRDHVEARARAAEAGPERDRRRDELRDLERAWRTLSALPVPDGEGPAAPRSSAAGARRAPRWLLAWAIASTLVAGVLGVQLATRGSFGPRVLMDGGGGGTGGGGEAGFALAAGGEEDEAGDGDGGEALDAGLRARLVARAEVEGAVLTIRSTGESAEVVAEGPADDSSYWLSPGAYELSVEHPDCADRWQQTLEVEGEEAVELEPELCKETGWMVVRSNVEGDELSIDGRKLGPSGEQRYAVAAGEHAVRVEKAGYQAWEGIVEVEPGQVLGIRPRLEAVVARERKPPKKAPAQVASAASVQPEEDERAPFESWHEDARRWLLSRYDFDRSGALDTREEVEAVPCEHWLGLEQSYDQSRLGLPLTRFYGFDGSGWRSGALGVSDDARDLAYGRMQACGLR